MRDFVLFEDPKDRRSQEGEEHGGRYFKGVWLSRRIMSKIRVNGFIEAFESMVVALEESRNKAAPLYRKAVEDWAVKTAEKARENLNRPSWLLSKQLSKVVRMKDGKIWSMVGILKERSSKRAPGYYFRFHEGGWRPNSKHKLTVEKRFVRRAKQATLPILKGEIAKASKEVTDVFKDELEKIRNRKKQRQAKRKRKVRDENGKL